MSAALASPTTGADYWGRCISLAQRSPSLVVGAAVTLVLLAMALLAPNWRLTRPSPCFRATR